MQHAWRRGREVEEKRKASPPDEIVRYEVYLPLREWMETLEGRVSREGSETLFYITQAHCPILPVHVPN